MTNSFPLFTDKTSIGDSEIFIAAGTGSPGAILECMIEVYGTFASASVQLYWKARNGTYYPTQDSPWTAADLKYARLNSNTPYKLVVSGVTGSTSISATAYNANAYATS